MQHTISHYQERHGIHFQGSGAEGIKILWAVNLTAMKAVKKRVSEARQAEVRQIFIHWEVLYSGLTLPFNPVVYFETSHRSLFLLP